jgi:hypothetical protein
VLHGQLERAAIGAPRDRLFEQDLERECQLIGVAERDGSRALEIVADDALALIDLRTLVLE